MYIDLTIWPAVVFCILWVFSPIFWLLLRAAYRAIRSMIIWTVLLLRDLTKAALLLADWRRLARTLRQARVNFRALKANESVRPGRSA